MRTGITYLAGLLLMLSCERAPKEEPRILGPLPGTTQRMDTVLPKHSDTLVPDDTTAYRINTGIVTPDQVVSFAMTLQGVPYQYGSCTRESGFDCSGFIYYVFNHFYIDVPRSSVDYTRVGKEVPVSAAKPGDLILFTGTNPANRTVGHMGIVTMATPDSLVFVHSSSGSANGVTMTPLNEHYRKRFVKVIRIFKQNEL